MGQFRKKPVVIDAWKWNFSPAQESSPSWVDNALNVWPQPGGIAFWPDGNHGNGAAAWANKPHLAVVTLEGVMIAEPGDFIITRVKGELYPCKPDIFAATYEAADKPPILTQREFASAPVDGTEIVYLHPNGYISSCAWRDADEGRAEGWWDDAIGEYVTPTYWYGALPKEAA